MHRMRNIAAFVAAWCMGAPVWATSLQFFGTGTNDVDRVKIRIDDENTAVETVPRPADIGDTDITIEFWIKGNAADNTGSVTCSGYGWISGNVVIDRDRYSQPRAYGIALGSGRVAFGVINGNNGTQTVCSSNSVLDGQWHHVAVQRAVSSGDLTIYIDGVQRGQASGNGSGGPISYPDDGVPNGACPDRCVHSDPFLVFGAEKHDAGGTLAFRGLLDEVRLSNVIRYTANFTRPSAAFNTDGNTAALYHLDEGTGTAVNDADNADGDQSNGLLSLGGNPQGPAWSGDTPFAASAGTLQFTSAATTIGEAAGTVPLTVSRVNGTSGAVTVDYATADGSAGSGDYSTTTGTLQWGNGDGAAKPLTVPILQDTMVEAAESFTVTLSAPSGGAGLGMPNPTTVTISDDDGAPPPAGVLAFSGATASVNEGAGAVVATITRTGGSTGAVSVNLATSNGSASAGSDYTATNTTQSWASGVTTARTVSIPIADDATVESAETFTVTLAGATGGATLGTPATFIVTIVDNDVAASPPPSNSGSDGGGSVGALGLLVLALLLSRRMIATRAGRTLTARLGDAAFFPMKR